MAEYLKDLNASRAYKDAGYTARGSVADSAASRLLKNVKVKAAIAQGLHDQVTKLELSAERVLRESARLAFLDIRTLYTATGDLKPMSEWDDAAGAAVEGIETEATYEVIDGERVQTGVRKKVKLWNKPSQLTLLAKHLKLLQESQPAPIVNIQIVVRTSLAEALQHAYTIRDASTTGPRALANGSGPPPGPDAAGG